MTGVDKLELPQFSIVELRLVSREVRFTTGEAAVKTASNLIRLEVSKHTLNDSSMLPKHLCMHVTTVTKYVIVTVGNMIRFGSG